MARGLDTRREGRAQDLRLSAAGRVAVSARIAKGPTPADLLQGKEGYDHSYLTPAQEPAR